MGYGQKWPTFPAITIPPAQRNREFPDAYQGKFFEEQGICVLRSGADALTWSIYWGDQHAILTTC